MKKTIPEIVEKYDLEIKKIIDTIKKEKAKKILVQFPDGMKPYATTIAEEIKNRSKIDPFIWLGSCFGACDIPIETENLGIDLIIQFGHSDWDYKYFKDLLVLK